MSSMTGTVLITGGTNGLGYEAALSIAKQRPQTQIVIASRSDADSAAAKINKATGHSNAVYMTLDLSSLEKTRSFAKAFIQKGYPPIKALLLNAGLQFPGKVQFSEDGIEKTVAITHVGHALLFYLLRDQLSDDARIIVTSSGTHDPAQKTGMPLPVFTTAEEVGRPDPQKATPDGNQRYTTSKLCNVLWTYALDRHLQEEARSGRQWTVNAFEPGLMPGTGLGRDHGLVFRILWYYVLPYTIPLLRLLLPSGVHTVRESGGNLAWVALSDETKGVSGRYFDGREMIKTSDVSYEVPKQEDLYEWTIAVVSKDKKEQGSFETAYGR